MNIDFYMVLKEKLFMYKIFKKENHIAFNVLQTFHSSDFKMSEKLF